MTSSQETECVYSYNPGAHTGLLFQIYELIVSDCNGEEIS